MTFRETSQPHETSGAPSSPMDVIPRVSVLVVAGETSGEQHAAALVREVDRLCPGVRIQWFGSGSQKMSQAGVDLLEDVSRLAAIGPWEAAGNLCSYWKLYRNILREVRLRRTRLAILVDFPDFNLRLARRLKQAGVTVVYFIAPQVWAWRSSRVSQIRRDVDLVLAVFPFEQEYFRSRGVNAHYVGNPSLERLREVAPGGGSGPREEPVVALLPGSRIQEVRRIFPRLLDAARYASRRCQARFWVVKAPDIPLEELKRVYRSWLGSRGKPLPLEFREEDTAQVLPRTDCAIIKSGTSTLEATLLRVPFAMVYRMSWPTWIFARLLVRTRTYSLTNLIMGERIVPEFIQWQARGRTIGRYLIRLLTDEGERASVRKKLGQAAGRLGRQNAYREAAMQVRRYLQE